MNPATFFVSLGREELQLLRGEARERGVAVTEYNVGNWRSATQETRQFNGFPQWSGWGKN